MIFVDSNVPMYLIGADHPHKWDAKRRLEELVGAREALVSDAEAFQEIMHRYAAIDRRDAIQPAFDVMLGVLDQVFDIRRSDVLAAKDVLLGAPKLGARDALHVAVMRARGITQILSFDRDFDRVPGIERIS